MRVISMIPLSGLSLVEMTFGEGIDVCVDTRFIASTSLCFTANSDLVTSVE